MKININSFKFLYNNSVKENRQSNFNYPNLAPLPKDTISFSGRGKLIAESMVDAPPERTCRQVEINAEPARFYLESVLDKYLKPLTQINLDSNPKDFPILEYTTRIKKSTSIREKVVSKYSKVYTSDADEFSHRVVDEFMKYFKLSDGFSKDFIIKEAKKLIASKVPPYEFASYYFSTIVSEFQKKNFLNFSDFPDDKLKQIFEQIIDSLEEVPKSPHTEGSVYIDPTSLKGVKHYANDIVGARITIRESDPMYTGLVLSALKRAVDDGLLKIISIENNLPDPQKLPEGKEIYDYAYATDSQLKNLANASNAELIKNTSKSGYLAIHINIDLSSPLFSCYKGVFDGYTGEIQIIGIDVEQLKDIEDLCYKLKDDKNALRSEYKPFKTYFKTYYNDETKDAFDDYTYSLYLAQRALPPNSKRSDFFPSISELGFDGLVPPELDFNKLRRLKKKCDYTAKLTQKQDEMTSFAKSSHSETIKNLKHNGDIKTVKSLISYVIKG